MSSSASTSSSDLESSTPPHNRSQKRQQLSRHEAESSSADSDDSDSSNDSQSDGEEGDEVVLSHAEKRRQKKKAERTAKRDTGPVSDAPSGKGKEKMKNTAELPPSKLPKRQNSIWIGNLSFKTTDVSLRTFFEGVGEIARIHMPMKTVQGGPAGRGPRKENQGFAYVDFATPDAKTVAITRSENPLDGRRLLIKDGDDFNGRPTPTAAAGANGADTSKATGRTKTAQKILAVQKQPPGPTLFLGNLGFETTEDSIHELLDSHRAKDTSADEKWIRKIRLGTFEDSGKCKGWAFVDFTGTEHATSALTNPRNHHLNGRKLVVEYASPEAVRRGGGGPPREKPREKGQAAKRAREHPARHDQAGAEEDNETEQPEQPTKKRRLVGEYHDQTKGREKGPRRVARSKPGAALAMAKREDPSIVPSQGKKIVF